MAVSCIAAATWTAYWQWGAWLLRMDGWHSLHGIAGVWEAGSHRTGKGLPWLWDRGVLGFSFSSSFSSAGLVLWFCTVRFPPSLC